MRLAVSFSHSAFYLLHGGKRPVRRTVSEAYDIEIPEVSSSEAPVAASWTQDVDGTPTGFQVRLYEGHFYEAHVQAEGHPNRPLETPEAYFAARQHSGQNDGAPAEHLIAHRLGDDRGEVTRREWKRYGSYLIVDGNPHVRCDDPRLAIGMEGGQPTIRIHRGWRIAHAAKGIDALIYEPVTRFDAVRDRFVENNVAVLSRVRDLEVIFPEAFEFDRIAEAFGRTVGQALFDSAPTLHAWPRELADRFLDLREAYGRWVASPDTEDAVTLLDEAYALLVGNGIYNPNRLANFLANYETVQAHLPDAKIPIDIVPKP